MVASLAEAICPSAKCAKCANCTCSHTCCAAAAAVVTIAAEADAAWSSSALTPSALELLVLALACEACAVGIGAAISGSDGRAPPALSTCMDADDKERGKNECEAGGMYDDKKKEPVQAADEEVEAETEENEGEASCGAPDADGLAAAARANGPKRTESCAGPPPIELENVRGS